MIISADEFEAQILRYSHVAPTPSAVNCMCVTAPSSVDFSRAYAAPYFAR
jgi:hypothetical protein